MISHCISERNNIYLFLKKMHTHLCCDLSRENKFYLVSYFLPSPGASHSSDPTGSLLNFPQQMRARPSAKNFIQTHWIFETSLWGHSSIISFLQRRRLSQRHGITWLQSHSKELALRTPGPASRVALQHVLLSVRPAPWAHKFKGAVRSPFLNILNIYFRNRATSL